MSTPPPLLRYGFSAFFLSLAVLLFGAVVVHGHLSKGPQSGSLETSGTVSDIWPSGNRSCTALITYSVDGAPYQVEVGGGEFLCRKQGDAVPVTYLPDRPAEGRPQLRSDLVLQVLMSVVSLGMVVLACLPLSARRAARMFGE